MRPHYTMPFVPFTQVELTCQHCGRRYEVSKKRLAASRYCGRPCYFAARRSGPHPGRVPAACLHCGDPFETERAVAGKGFGKYCSSGCYHASQVRTQTVVCGACGTTFPAKRHEIRRGGGKFCTPACYRESQRGVRIPLAERFWAKVDKAGPIVRPELGPCWLWTAALQKKTGYGLILVDGSPKLAHRVVCLLDGIAIPDGMDACHRCDTRACVNPSHIFAGTDADNMRDAALKDRKAVKLSIADVQEIRRRATQGERVGDLARAFGLSHAYVSQIISRDRRQHV